MPRFFQGKPAVTMPPGVPEDATPKSYDVVRTVVDEDLLKKDLMAALHVVVRDYSTKSGVSQWDIAYMASDLLRKRYGI